MKIVKINKLRPKDVIKALKNGGVVFPMLGGGCLLSIKPDELKVRLGQVFRLVSDDEVPEEFRIFKGKPVAIISDEENGWAYTPSVLQDVVKMLPEGVWFGILDEFGDEFDDKWVVLRVEDGDERCGPTVVNFRSYPPLVERKGKVGILELEEILGKVVKIGPSVIFSILVICTGNTCRSPIALGLLKEALKGERVVVSSCGIAAPVGSPPTKFAIEVAKSFGVDISGHRARVFRPEMATGADLILVMEKRHKERIALTVPEAEGKIRLLGGYPDEEREIPDPIGRSFEVYQEAGLLIKAGVLRVVGELKARLGKGE